MIKLKERNGATLLVATDRIIAVRGVKAYTDSSTTVYLSEGLSPVSVYESAEEIEALIRAEEKGQ